MARVKYGGLVSEISGSIGGSTFQKSLYGNTLRNKPIPIHKRTPSQVTLRYQLQQLHSAWRGLSADERLQWNRFINFSNQSIRRNAGILMTGHDLFIKYNLAKLMIGDAILTVPTYIAMPAFVTVDPTYMLGSDGTTLIFAVTDVYDQTKMFCLLKLTSPRIPSRIYSKQGLRNIPLTYDGSGTFGIATAYKAIFGFVPNYGVTVHYWIQWFSRIAPLFGSPLTGIVEIISI